MPPLQGEDPEVGRRQGPAALGAPGDDRGGAGGCRGPGAGEKGQRRDGAGQGKGGGGIQYGTSPNCIRLISCTQDHGHVARIFQVEGHRNLRGALSIQNILCVFFHEKG